MWLAVWCNEGKKKKAHAANAINHLLRRNCWAYERISLPFSGPDGKDTFAEMQKAFGNRLFQLKCHKNRRKQTGKAPVGIQRP